MSIDQAPGAMAVRDESRAITQADPEELAGALLHVLGSGDLAQLTNEQRLAHYLNLCNTLGLNALSRPFDWLVIKGKLVLYPNKSCAEQLRRIHQINVRIIRSEIVGGESKDPMYVCTVEGRSPNGRTEQSTKYVSLLDERGNRLRGNDLANAYAKGETSAKRRLAFAMVGLASVPDPEEMQGARTVVVDGTGQIVEHPTDQQRALADDPALAKMLRELTYETTASDSDSPLVGTVSQAPTIEELEPPKRPYQPPASFRGDEERWRKTWHAVVKGTFLDSDEARHDFIGWYTSGWPEDRQTRSLTTFLHRATDRQAETLTNTARETIAERTAAEAADPDGELDGIDGLTSEQALEEATRQRGQDHRPTAEGWPEGAPRFDAGERVEAAAVLTGAAPRTRTVVQELARPEEGKSYTAAQWRGMYVVHAGRLRQLDVTFRTADPDALKGAELQAAVLEVIDTADAIEASFRDALDAEDEADGDQGETVAADDQALAF